jgi:hypothetical protein
MACFGPQRHKKKILIRFKFYVKAVTLVQRIQAYVFYTPLTKSLSIWDFTMQ